MTPACRKDIQECDVLVVLIDLLRWNIAGKNLAEYALGLVSAHDVDANRAMRWRAMA